MSTRSTLFLLVLFLSSILMAQNQKVIVERNIRKAKETTEAVFTATNTSSAKQTIILELNGGNYRGANSQASIISTITPGKINLVTLTEVNGAPGYRYNYVQGCLNIKPKEVTYLLPVAPGKTTKIDTLSNINTVYFGRKHPKNWLAYSMATSPGDTIFASRRGTVITVESEKVSEFKSGLAYSSFRTHLIVEHEDCTYSNYELFEEKGVMVEVGQYIEAGEPLGLVQDGTAYINGSHLRFMVYYPKLSRDEMKRISENSQHAYAFQYISPKFANIGTPRSGETYQSEHPEALIFQEMSKREIKKWKKAKLAH